MCGFLTLYRVLVLPKLPWSEYPKLVLLPGQRHDLHGVKQLLEGIGLRTLLANKAFDADWLKQHLLAHSCQVMIAQKAHPRAPLQIDMEVYKWRNLIESFFCKLKEFKRIAMS